MVRRPPLSTRPDSLFPYPALFLSPGFQLAPGGGPVGVDELFTEARVEGVVAREPFAGAGVAPEVDDVSGSGGHGGSGSGGSRSEEHTSELQSLMRNSYAVFCLKKKQQKHSICDLYQ